MNSSLVHKTLDIVLLCFMQYQGMQATNTYVYICTISISSYNMLYQGFRNVHQSASGLASDAARDEVGAGEVPALFCCLEFGSPAKRVAFQVGTA